MSHTIVIFGASGDLTQRKLIPALYRLHEKGRLPEATRVVGFSRTPITHEAWRASLLESTTEHLGAAPPPAAWQQFASGIFYRAGDIDRAEDFTALGSFLGELESGQRATRIYYLATAPQFYEPTSDRLRAAGLADEAHGVRRVVVEKPFGVDRASARRLNDAIHRAFSERQVYRIDHYLGKETVQNVMVLRFANAIFEPIWNRNYIDHVQITAAEEVLVGRRGGYYDRSGILRDMFQNHLLQLLSITAMEAPSRFEADAIRNEKVKVLEAIRILDDNGVREGAVRGQYRGYTSEEGVPPQSRTATFAAVRLSINNWRWQGVPFYLRSGKAMSCRSTQIVIQFRQPPHLLFGKTNGDDRQGANRLVIQLQPKEGIQLHFETKVPDAGMRLRQTELAFRFDNQFAGRLPEAYERLLLDTLQGDASLFARSDEVEAAWSIIDPIAACWERTNEPKLHPYVAGGWGPDACTEWMLAQGREWFDTCPALK